eukprot:jgi/Hompol1/4376/HPOL_003628-RA
MAMGGLQDDPSRLYSSPWWLGGLAVGAVLALFTTALSLYLTFRHFQFYTRPKFQRPITRILLMVPTYAICSWFSFLSIESAIFLDLVRDCYEGFVVYNFLVLFLEFLGRDEQTRLEVLASKSRRLLPPPACCISHTPGYRHFLGYCRLGIMQYVVIRVSTTVAAVILELNGVYCPESMSPEHGHFYTTVLNGISVGTAMFTLFSLYLPIRHDIASFSPVLKFLSIKFIVFVSFWLGIAINLLVANGVIRNTETWSIHEFSILLQNFVVLVEMAVAAILHIWAFDYLPYVPESGTPTPIAVGLWDSLYWLDLWNDAVFIAGFVSRRITKLGRRLAWSQYEPLPNSPVPPQSRLSMPEADLGDTQSLQDAELDGRVPHQQHTRSASNESTPLLP